MALRDADALPDGTSDKTLFVDLQVQAPGIGSGLVVRFAHGEWLALISDLTDQRGEIGLRAYPKTSQLDVSC